MSPPNVISSTARVCVPKFRADKSTSSEKESAFAFKAAALSPSRSKYASFAPFLKVPETPRLPPLTAAPAAGDETDGLSRLLNSILSTSRVAFKSIGCSSAEYTFFRFSMSSFLYFPPAAKTSAAPLWESVAKYVLFSRST